MNEISNKDVLKKYLDTTPKKQDETNINIHSSGLYDIKMDETVFNCFLYRRKSNKLYIFLSAIGNEKTVYPYFTRISWPIWLEGNALFVEDPTRRDYKVAPAFYMGKVDNYYFDKLSKLIALVKNELKIENKNIIFISSSNGGYASINLCHEFKGATVIAYNPQFSAKLYFEQHKDKYKLFSEKTGIDLEHCSWTNNEFAFLSNNESSFLVYINLASNDDLEQLRLLKQKLNIGADDLTKPGVYKLKNKLYLALADIKSDNPHIAQPNLDCTKIFIKLLEDKIQFDDVQPVYNLVVSALKQEFLSSSKESNISPTKINVSTVSDKVAIVFRCTSDFAFSVSNMIISIEKYGANRNIDYIVYTDEINSESFNQCKVVASHFKRTLLLKPYDLSKVEKIGIKDSFLQKRYTYIIFSLFEIFNLLNEYKHVFALDTDMLVLDDFFEIIGKGEFCFRPARKISDVVSKSFDFDDEKCPNAAFIYLNHNLNFHSLTERCYQILAKYKDYIKVTYEQVCLAILIYENKIKVTYLGEEYNCPFASANINKAKIVHYITTNKPWESEDVLIAIPEYVYNLNKFNRITFNKFSDQNINCKKSINASYKELFYAKYNSLLLSEIAKLGNYSVEAYSFSNRLKFKHVNSTLNSSIDMVYSTNWFFMGTSISDFNNKNNIKSYALNIYLSFENNYNKILNAKSKLLSFGYKLIESDKKFVLTKTVSVDFVFDHLLEISTLFSNT